MSCPSPETLSRWNDGALDAREAAALGRHLEGCAACRLRVEEIREAADWLENVGETGPWCLSAEEMAALVEGKPSSTHVEGCPRCAAELRALRPARKRATLRVQGRPASASGWAAAAALVVIGVLIVLATRSGTPPRSDVVRAPEPLPPPVRPVETAPLLPSPPAPRPEPTAPAPPAPKPDVQPPVLAPAPKLEVQPPTPAPAPEPVKPAPPETRAETVAAPPTRSFAAYTLRGGALSMLSEGKWVSASRAEEGAPLRAEGRTSLEFARARVTLEGSSRFALAKDELALAEGGLSAEVPAGSRFSVALGPCRIVPQAACNRVLLSARPDRVVVEEGAARSGDLILPEGIEHQLRRDRLEPQKRRTLPAGTRPRETVTWRLDLSNLNVVRKGLTGRVDTVQEGRIVACRPLEDKSFFDSFLGYMSLDEQGLFAVKANTALRFRYFLIRPAPVQFVAWNITKKENFNLDLETVSAHWTTVTLFLRDVPANPGGKKVACEIGDRFRSVGLFIGKPGSSPDLYIDRLEIVEIER